jgi:hypothetical protein
VGPAGGELRRRIGLPQLSSACRPGRPPAAKTVRRRARWASGQIRPRTWPRPRPLVPPPCLLRFGGGAQCVDATRRGATRWVVVNSASACVQVLRSSSCLPSASAGGNWCDATKKLTTHRIINPLFSARFELAFLHFRAGGRLTASKCNVIGRKLKLYDH